MKKYFLPALTCIILALTGCEEDKTVIEEIIHTQPSASSVKQNPEDEILIELNAGDKIGINGLTCAILANGQISLYDVPATANYLIYHPSDAQATENAIKFSLPARQDLQENKVNPTTFPLYAYTDNEGLEEVLLNAVCGVLKLEIPAADEGFESVTSISIQSDKDELAGDITFDAVQQTLTSFENTTRTLTLEGGIDLSEKKNVLISLPPMTFTDKLHLTFFTTKGMGTCSIDLNGKTIKTGEILSVALSDIKWEATTFYYGTANSILINPGTSQATVDCTPYYTTDLTYAYENLLAGEDHLPQSARLLWSDVSSDFVTGITLSQDQKSFSFQLNGQTGNAVIAIYDHPDPSHEDANVLWSFHIWVTDIQEQDLGTNANGNHYAILDRNLGATSIVPGDIQSSGLLYQWGRKDPFTGSSAFGTNNEPVLYNAEGTTEISIVSGNATNGTVSYATQHPDAFIKYSRSKSNTSTQPYYYSYDWLYIGDNALWGNPEGYDMPAASTIKKSVYDPCPEGYMVAPRDTWMDKDNTSTTIFENGEWDSERLGYKATYNEQTLWFPTTGLRNRKTGKLQETEQNGYYWYNCPEGAKKGNGAYLIVNSSITEKSNNRGNAYAVRCVRVLK